MLGQLLLLALLVATSAFRAPLHKAFQASRRGQSLHMQGDGLPIDMKGKTVFIAGVADSTGYGWAIAKACAEAGAKILLGTWPPVLQLFQLNLERGQHDEDMILTNGKKMEISKVFTV